VPTLEEALLTAKGKSWLIWTKHMTFLTMYMGYWKNRTKSSNHERRTAYRNCQTRIWFYLDKVLYMPVIDLGNKEAEKIITDYLKELQDYHHDFLQVIPIMCYTKSNFS